MRKSAKIVVIGISLAACILWCKPAAAINWQSYGPFVGPEANLDIDGGISQMGMAMDNNLPPPTYSCPRIAYFYKAQTNPYIWQVKYNYYDGAAWHEQVLLQLEEHHYSDATHVDYLRYYPQAVALALTVDPGTGQTVGGIAFAYCESYAWGNPSTVFYCQTWSHIRYVPILPGGAAGSQEFIIPDIDWGVVVEPVPGVPGGMMYFNPVLAHRGLSLAFHSNVQPAVAFTTNVSLWRDDEEDPHIDRGWVCYRSKAGGGWSGSQWTGDGFTNTIDEFELDGGICQSIRWEDVCLVMNPSLPIGSEACVAYTFTGGAALPDSVLYAAQSGGSFVPEIVEDGVLSDPDNVILRRVSLALDSVFPYRPNVVYESRGISFEAKDLTAGWALPSQLVIAGSADFDDRYTRLGSLKIDPNPAASGARWFSTWVDDAGSTYLQAWRMSAPSWTWVAYDVSGGLDDWRPVLDIDARCGSPLVAAVSSTFLGTVGHVEYNPSIYITVQDEKSGASISGATVQWVGATPVGPDAALGGTYVYNHRTPQTHNLVISKTGYDTKTISNVAVSWGLCTLQLGVKLRPNPYGCSALPAYGAASGSFRPAMAFLPLIPAGVGLTIWLMARRRKVTTS